jgi:hypothetical protein
MIKSQYDYKEEHMEEPVLSNNDLVKLQRDILWSEAYGKMQAFAETYAHLGDDDTYNAIMKKLRKIGEVCHYL